ncbi:hypothetical protein [Streptomyces massasporeus]
MVTKEPGAGSHHALAFIRELQQGEKEEIDAAQRLLRSFSANWDGNSAARSLEHFDKIFEECVTGIQKASGHYSDNDRSMLSRAAIEASHTIASWPSKVLSGEYEHLGADAKDRENIETVAKKLLAADAPINLLSKISECNNDSLVSVTQVERSGRKGFIAYFRKEVLQEVGISQAENWVVQEILTVGLSQLQYLGATILKCHRKVIEEAGKVLLSLHTETLYGQPMLIPKENLSNLGKGAADLSLAPVENPNLEGILRATDAAEKLLDAAGSKGSPAPPATAPIAEPIKPRRGEGKTGELPEASDLAALFTYVSRLSTDLERRWSSLISDAGSEDHKEALNKWYSFISSLKNRIEKQGQRDPQGEHSIGPFPLRADSFTPRPDPVSTGDALKEVETAELYATRNLLNVMQALSKPTTVQIDLATGQETRWWESGAFNLVRRAAEVAIRVVDRRDELIEMEKTATTAPPDVRVGGLFLHANLSRAAMDQGMPEAALIYCALALRDVSTKLGAVGVSPEEAAAVIGSELRSELQEPARQAMALASDIAAGVDTRVEQVFNLANFWCDSINSLIEAALTHNNAAGDESDK